MTKYREILRLQSLGLSQNNIALSCSVSKKTVSKVLKRAKELDISWPFDDNLTDADISEMLYSSENKPAADIKRRLPDYAYIRKELLKNGVSKKLLWTEYCEDARQSGEIPLMYSQFCYYIQQDEQKRRASMHIARKPAEQIEVDWAGDPAQLIGSQTGEITNAYLFVGVMTYSQYAYVEAFPDEKQASWIMAHVHMYEFFGGVSKILVPDNTKTAVIRSGWKDQKINAVYQEMAEHYNTAIIPARVRKPKDKPNAEGVVGLISTWITAALRKEQFFTLRELNEAIKTKLDFFNRRPFQKKEGSRLSLFLEEEQPRLSPLPATPYELAEWKTATVQYNYHISVDGMLYSVPYGYIKKRVDVRVTTSTVEVFYDQKRIASHLRLKGRKNQYSTVTEHMPKDHRDYLEWNGDRFRNWAESIGEYTYKTIDAMLTSRVVEQQAYKGCMALLKLKDKYPKVQIEEACKRALSYTSSPSYKSIQNILVRVASETEDEVKPARNPYGITRGANYYNGGGHHV